MTTITENLGGIAATDSTLNALNVVQQAPTDLDQPLAENEMLRTPQQAAPQEAVAAMPVAHMPAVATTLPIVPANNQADWERFLRENRDERKEPSRFELIRGWLDSTAFSMLRNKERGAWIYSKDGLFNFLSLAVLKREPMAAWYYDLYQSAAQQKGFDAKDHVVVLFDPNAGLDEEVKGSVCRRSNACTSMVELPCTLETFKPLA